MSTKKQTTANEAIRPERRLVVLCRRCMADDPCSRRSTPIFPVLKDARETAGQAARKIHESPFTSGV